MDYLKKAEEMFAYMRQINKVPMFKEISGVSQGEMAALAFLTFEHDGATAGELTEAFGVGSSRTAALLNTLTRKGFAKRVQDPEDGRRVLVYVTEAGRREAEKTHFQVTSHMAEFLSLLGPEDAETFIRIIKNAVLRNGAIHSEEIE